MNQELLNLVNFEWIYIWIFPHQQTWKKTFVCLLQRYKPRVPDGFYDQKMDFEMILFQVEHFSSSALKPGVCEMLRGLEARRFLGSR